jgi:hypothetical protein
MMSNEEFERKMAFIVNQQAKFEVDVEKLYEAQMLTEQKLQEANAVVTRLAYVTSEGFKDVNAKLNVLMNSQIATSEGFKDVNAKINALVNSQTALQDSQKQTDEQLRRTSEQTERTEVALRRLSETVDHYIRNRRDGG